MDDELPEGWKRLFWLRRLLFGDTGTVKGCFDEASSAAWEKANGIKHRGR